MVAILTRIFGLHNLELAEDVVQEAFMKALKEWTFRIPDNPSAWLLLVAKNKAIAVGKDQQVPKDSEQNPSTEERNRPQTPMSFLLDTIEDQTRHILQPTARLQTVEHLYNHHQHEEHAFLHKHTHPNTQIE